MINKPYKINRNDYDEIYFTSDQHYSHNPKWNTPPLWQTREFKSVIEQDQWLENEYSKVSSKSLIISLGDPALNSSPEKLLNFFNKTSASIWLLFGNHFGNDYGLYKESINTYHWVNSMQKKPLDRNAPLLYEIYPFTLNRIRQKFIEPDDLLLIGTPGLTTNLYSMTFLGEKATFNIGNTFFQCNHFAPLIWDKMKHDNFVSLVGHSHGNLERANVKNGENKQLDVGVDNSIKFNGTAFFKYEEVVNIMKTKNIKTFDHHGDEDS